MIEILGALFGLVGLFVFMSGLSEMISHTWTAGRSPAGGGVIWGFALMVLGGAMMGGGS